MREAQVPITSRAECQTVYTNAGAPIDATMLCAGRTNLDTCQGDSGGPLFFKAAGGGFIQAGITSWGFGCAPPASPGSTPASATGGWGTSSSRSPDGCR
jgi:secreted trypsin-like serine protease